MSIYNYCDKTLPVLNNNGSIITLTAKEDLGDTTSNKAPKSEVSDVIQPESLRFISPRNGVLTAFAVYLTFNVSFTITDDITGIITSAVYIVEDSILVTRLAKVRLKPVLKGEIASGTTVKGIVTDLNGIIKFGDEVAVVFYAQIEPTGENGTDNLFAKASLNIL
ncbi:MAG: hypothetical protein LBK29_01720 [Oscillospiraceae bacterium]|jgi:hypothetical protein|nr:hypothetical protein [Oscillospiraceae bacterium]